MSQAHLLPPFAWDALHDDPQPGVTAGSRMASRAGSRVGAVTWQQRPSFDPMPMLTGDGGGAFFDFLTHPAPPAPAPPAPPPPMPPPPQQQPQPHRTVGDVAIVARLVQQAAGLLGMSSADREKYDSVWRTVLRADQRGYVGGEEARQRRL